jgi:hypothetical protein
MVSIETSNIVRTNTSVLKLSLSVLLHLSEISILAESKRIEESNRSKGTWKSVGRKTLISRPTVKVKSSRGLGNLGRSKGGGRSKKSGKNSKLHDVKSAKYEIYENVKEFEKKMRCFGSHAAKIESFYDVCANNFIGGALPHFFWHNPVLVGVSLRVIKTQNYLDS